MPRIQQLPPHEAHKIAAGEVVDRPANVVKELIENALDAHATQITVYIEEAGKKLIRIVDNGHGMDAEDAILCFGHHATSKIRCVDDLQSIGTFGFRGEALSSIAAVSEVTLITKEITATPSPSESSSLKSTSAEGIKVRVVGGRMEPETFVSCNPGTDISIENLFFNVPARKKFLKTDDTEWRQIVLLFQAFCLDYWAVSFKLFHNNQLIHNCPATTDLASRITQLWDHTFSNAMLSLSAQKNEIIISGAISHQHYARYDRTQIFLFVNKRWIKNQHLSRALLRGYMNVLPPARYPAACIFITIPPQEVDINIHPRKEEAQFMHPRIVEVLIQDAVKKTLENNITHKIRRGESSTSSFDFDAPVFQNVGTVTVETAASDNGHGKRTSLTDKNLFAARDTSPLPATSLQQPPPSTISFAATPSRQSLPSYQSLSPSPATPPPPPAPSSAVAQTTLLPRETDASEAESYTIIGQLHKTYLVLEHPEGLFFWLTSMRPTSAFYTNSFVSGFMP